jgi:hypothetical protein
MYKQYKYARISAKSTCTLQVQNKHKNTKQNNKVWAFLPQSFDQRTFPFYKIL